MLVEILLNFWLIVILLNKIWKVELIIVLYFVYVIRILEIIFKMWKEDVYCKKLLNLS